QTRRRKAQIVEALPASRRIQTAAFGCESMQPRLLRLFQQNRRSEVIAGATADEEASLRQLSEVGYRRMPSTTRIVKLPRSQIHRPRLARFVSEALRFFDPVAQASVGWAECLQLVPWRMETRKRQRLKVYRRYKPDFRSFLR